MSLTLCVMSQEGRPTRPPAMATSGMVSSPHYLASLAGLKILEIGGSAVDAAIAVNSTLGVVYPHMTGMGGDAFWLIHDPDGGKVHALNGSGRSVAKATRDRFRSTGYTAIPQRGPLSCVTVPGALDSWCAAHEQFGRLSLADDLQQATAYARDGYPVSAAPSRFTAATARGVAAHGPTARRLVPDGTIPAVGELLRFRGRAQTRDLVAQKGRAGFYEGEVAADLTRAIAQADGLWEVGDLASHQSTW